RPDVAAVEVRDAGLGVVDPPRTRRAGDETLGDRKADQDDLGPRQHVVERHLDRHAVDRGSTFGPRAERVVAVKDLDARVDVGDPSEVPAERRRDDRDVDGQITAPEIFAARIASMSKPIDARIASVSPANSLAGRSSGGVRSNCTGLATSGRLRSSEYG